MMKILIRLLVVFCFFVTVSVSAETFTDPDKPIMLKPHEMIFVLKLKSNPTTGYSWFLRKPSMTLFESIQHRYVAPNVKRMGASGYELWTFKLDRHALNVPHYFKIKMIYARPWQSPPADTVFKVYINR